MSFCDRPARLDVGETCQANGAKDAVSADDLHQRSRVRQNGRGHGQESDRRIWRLHQSIIQSGNFKAGDRLQPASTATTVRVRDGKTLTTDGPFAETREQLGGYYLIEAKDLDAALGIAARIPGARYGSIEVRPIWVYN